MERITGNGYAEDRQGLAALVGSLVDQPFDLSQDHMLRVHLVEEITAAEHLLVINLHHIASDGWSKSILVRELAALYTCHATGARPDLPMLTVQYADYAIWQRRHLRGATLEEKLDYWRSKLSGLQPLSLPLDHVRPAEQSTQGKSLRTDIDQETMAGLRAISGAGEATLFMTMLAVFKVLLYRYSGQEDICVGTPIAGRTQQETESLVGFFINMLALRTCFSGDDTFKSLLQLVKQTTLEAFEQQDVPFAKVVEEIVHGRDLSRSPLFQVLFVMQNTPEATALRLGTDTVLTEENIVMERTKFDLTFTVFETGEGAGLHIEYCTDLFDSPTIERMMHHYKELLHAVVTSPDTAVSSLPMLTKDETNRILTEFNHPYSPAQESPTLLDLFNRQCAQHPESIAVVAGKRQLTYRGLDEKSNQLAHYLISRGVQENTLVALCIDRSVEQVIGIWGIMKAGAAYVPIDPELPSERIAHMLFETATGFVLSSKTAKEALPAAFAGEVILLDGNREQIGTHPLTPPQTALNAESLAYVIYTSGSTGKPKGAMITHRNVVAMLTGFRKTAPPLPPANDTQQAGLMVCSYAFDVSVWELFANLCYGSQLHVLSKEQAVDEEYLAHYIIEHRITTAYLPPTLLAGIVTYFEWHTENNTTPIHLTHLLVGVMPIREELLQRFRRLLPGAHIINGYGPTETTICATFYSFINASQSAGNTPIGSPVSNYRVYLLQHRKTLVPVGVPGEICIAGAGVGKGYVNNPALTAAAFIPDPFIAAGQSLPAGEDLMYCTGDLGRWTEEGHIVYAGRMDDQVKVNGYRIEPGEIESVLRQSGLVSACVVLTGNSDQANSRLAAFVVPTGAFDPDRLIWYLQGHLPEYMIPRLWIPLDALPLTISGKIDRALLISKIPKHGLNAPYVAPRTPTEKELSDLLKDLLKTASIGMKDNFFSLGGNSLLAIQLLSRIRKKFRLNIPVKTIFKFPQIDQIAEYIDLFSGATLHEDEPEAYEVFEL